MSAQKEPSSAPNLKNSINELWPGFKYLGFGLYLAWLLLISDTCSWVSDIGADGSALLNGNLLDYKMPTSMDHPELTALFVETDDPSGPFGNKALGEPPACSGAPAIRNAIYNATGVAVDTIPITPHVLFAEFTKVGLIHDSWNEKEGK